MKPRGEGKRAAAGSGKAGGRLRVLEQFVTMERLPMSNEWVVKLGNKNGAQIDIRQCVTKQEAVNLTHFVGQIVLEILEEGHPGSLNDALTVLPKTKDERGKKKEGNDGQYTSKKDCRAGSPASVDAEP